MRGNSRVQTHAVVIWSEHVTIRTDARVVADAINTASNATYRCIHLALVRV